MSKLEELDGSNHTYVKYPTKIPRYHDFLAEGISEKQAMAWHNAIMLLESHAQNLAERAEEVIYAMPVCNGTLLDALRYFKSCWTRIK